MDAGPVVGITSRGGAFVRDVTNYFHVTGIVDLGRTYSPDLEAVRALNPDLITVDGSASGRLGYDEDVLRVLRAIAPVVGINPNRPVEEVMADHPELVGAAATRSLADQAAELTGLLAELRGVLGERLGRPPGARRLPADQR